MDIGMTRGNHVERWNPQVQVLGYNALTEKVRQEDSDGRNRWTYSYNSLQDHYIDR